MPGGYPACTGTTRSAIFMLGTTPVLTACTNSGILATPLVGGINITEQCNSYTFDTNYSFTISAPNKPNITINGSGNTPSCQTITPYFGQSCHITATLLNTNVNPTATHVTVPATEGFGTQNSYYPILVAALITMLIIYCLYRLHEQHKK